MAEGGDKGGEVVDEGTPEDVARNKNSYTGEYLKALQKEEGANGNEPFPAQAGSKDVAHDKRSYTGPYLKLLLSSPASAAAE